MVEVSKVVRGAKVAVVPLSVTLPAIPVDPCCRVKVAVVIVRGFTASLKVADMLLPVAISVDPFTGMVEMTVGADELPVEVVMNVHEYFAARALPERSIAPVVIVAV